MTEIAHVRAEALDGCTLVVEAPPVYIGVTNMMSDHNKLVGTPLIGTKKRMV